MNNYHVREKHFPALDGLRGLAALMVVAHHSAALYSTSGAFDKAYLRTTSMLWVGVDLFFVLSGFLITNILLETRTSSQYFRAFYGRRVVRIFPLYYSYLVILFILLPMCGIGFAPDLLHNQLWQWTYTSNIFNAFHYWQDVNINHFWTLAIEEQFYLLWPIIVFAASERTLKFGIAMLFLFLPFLRWYSLMLRLPPLFAYTFTPCHIDGLLIGAMISLSFRNGLLTTLSSAKYRSATRTLDWLIGGSVLIFIIAYCCFLRNDQFLFNWEHWPRLGQSVGISLISLIFGYAVLRSIGPSGNVFQRALGAKYLRRVGQYSYALYVLHVPICHWVGNSFPAPPWLQNLPPTWSFLHSVYIIIIQFSLSIAAAIFSWNLLEKHFLNLKKYFPYQKKMSIDAAPELIVESA